MKRLMRIFKKYPITVLRFAVRNDTFQPIKDKGRRVIQKNGAEYYELQSSGKRIAPQSFDDIYNFSGQPTMLLIESGRGYSSLTPTVNTYVENEDGELEEPEYGEDGLKILNGQNVVNVPEFVADTEELDHNVNFILDEVQKAKEKYATEQSWLKQHATEIIAIVALIGAAILLYVTGQQVTETATVLKNAIRQATLPALLSLSRR